MEEIKISVRNLVEFLLRSGDIDNRRGGLADKEAMQQGSRLHRKIQGKMGIGYKAEVPLKYSAECEEYTLTIEGRADGIQSTETETIIDEIKGVYRELALIEEPVPIHLAQAKCYAAIYGSQQDFKQISVQMTYANLETEEIRRFKQEYTVKELTEWFLSLIAEYQRWCDFRIQWSKIRLASIKDIVFPFTYRAGQKELAVAVYRTMYRKKQLFIQAPTGIGKTISTVFPAVKAVGEGLGGKIFYLTAKTITRTVAEEAFSLLERQGLRYKVITLTAKEKICPQEVMDCNPDTCPYAKGHFDRINEAVFDMITNQMDFSRESLQQQSEKWQVCPYELSLDVSLWMDAVICDYNYVFDPRAHLKRFFGDSVRGDYLFLIDEAHNLVERGREMFSAALYKEEFLKVKKLVKLHSKKLSGRLERCNRKMLEWKRECENYKVLENVEDFILPVLNLSTAMEEYLEDAPFGETREAVLKLYFQVRSFLDIYDRLDDNYVIYTEETEGTGFGLKLFCVNPSENLQQCLDKGNSAIFFSATLLPIAYYTSLLSGRPDDYRVYAKSPFDPENKKLLIGSDVSSRYTRRGEEEYRKIAAYIHKAISKRKGNYMVFFPSYRMLQDVTAYLEEMVADQIRVMKQESGMSEAEREDFLAAFTAEQEGELIGCCVMGGIFSEGIDLKNDHLIGAILVGTGLPQICNEREILKNYYSSKRKDGFAYAYQYPGMNKVLQSAGRVIRTQEDRGIILLLDDRFLLPHYVDLFPREWADYDRCTLKTIEEKIMCFWQGK